MKSPPIDLISEADLNGNGLGGEKIRKRERERERERHEKKKKKTQRGTEKVIGKKTKKRIRER